MKSRDCGAFISDVYRLRPLVTVVLAILIMLPSFSEVISSGLSMVVLLMRLAETLFFVGTLVWITSGVLIHYANVQAKTPESDKVESELRS